MKKSLIALIIAVVILVLAVGGYFIKNSIDKKSAEEASIAESLSIAEELSLLHDSLEAYGSLFDETTSTIFSDCADAEKMGNLIVSVWENCIFETDNEDTNKYTKDDNSVFYEDFNDALAELFADEDFSAKIQRIRENQVTMTSNVRQLREAPEGFEDCYDALKKCYDDYIALTTLVINPSGNLYEFSDSFDDADTAAANSMNALQLLIQAL